MIKKELQPKKWDVCKQVGMICKLKRIEMNVSQKDMAETLGVTPGLISQFENGISNSAFILVGYITNLGVKI